MNSLNCNCGIYVGLPTLDFCPFAIDGICPYDVYVLDSTKRAIHHPLFFAIHDILYFDTEYNLWKNMLIVSFIENALKDDSEHFKYHLRLGINEEVMKLRNELIKTCRCTEFIDIEKITIMRRYLNIHL